MLDTGLRGGGDVAEHRRVGWHDAPSERLQPFFRHRAREYITRPVGRLKIRRQKDHRDGEIAVAKFRRAETGEILREE